jgi:hypothetical protein
MKPNHLKTIILPVFILISTKISAWENLEHVLPNEKIQSKNENPYPSIGAIPLPADFVRMPVEKNSFADWLRNLPLKKNKIVYLYNGMPKEDQSAQFAVIDISTGNKDLQQCADAVMRLRAEYLYGQKKFTEIVFFDNSGHAYRFEQPFNRDHFDHYLENVFAHCGSLSLQKQLHDLSRQDLAIGDVLIQGGSPGHAMQVVDMASSKQGKKIFLLAQGFMPAQDMHVVVNPHHLSNPWYDWDNLEISTPGWIFPRGKFKRW